MRTDCNIYEWTKIRLPQIPAHSAGRKSEAQRGDIILFSFGDDPAQHIGRVIASVTAEDIDGHYLVVAMLLGTTCCERWVSPSWVIDCHSVQNYDKLQWLFGPEFLNTSVELARQCFDKLASELIKTKEENHGADE